MPGKIKIRPRTLGAVLIQTGIATAAFILLVFSELAVVHKIVLYVAVVLVATGIASLVVWLLDYFAPEFDQALRGGSYE